MSGRAAALIGVVLAMFLGACSSGDRTLDASKLEREIRVYFERSNRVTSVECPDDVKAQRGNSFTCTARVEGKRRIIDVVQRNDDGRVELSVRP